MTLEEYIVDFLKRGNRGGFAAELATAWCVADSTNRAKLVATWPDIFKLPSITPLRRYQLFVDRPVWMQEVYTFEVPDSIAEEDIEQACISSRDGMGVLGIRELDASTPEYVSDITNIEPKFTVRRES